MLAYYGVHGSFMSPEMKVSMLYTKLFVYVWFVFVTTIIAIKLDRIIKLLEDRKKGE